MTRRQGGAASALGDGLLAYLVAATLLITLAPFRFAWPERIAPSWGGSWGDAAANVLLFVPLGFLWGLRRRDRDGGDPPAWLAGLLASSAIELTQLFTVGRHTAPLDVVTNTAGAALGGVLARRLGQKLSVSLVESLALELPLTSAFYLLGPLLWLNAMESREHPVRVVQAALLGAAGASLALAVWRQRLAAVVPRPTVAMGLGAWFLVTSAPGLLVSPGAFAATAALLAVGAAAASRPVAPGGERRFERPALRAAAPPFLAYLVLLAGWGVGAGPWQAVAGLRWVDADPDALEVLAVVEYVAAFTLLGFAVAEYLGREPWSRARTRVLGGVVGAAAGLEALRGFHPLYGASLLHGLLAAGSAFAGARLYALQLRAFRRATRPPPGQAGSRSGDDSSHSATSATGR